MSHDHVEEKTTDSLGILEDMNRDVGQCISREVSLRGISEAAIALCPLKYFNKWILHSLLPSGW